MAELVVKLVNGELAGKTMQSLTKEVNAAATAFKKAEVGTQEWVNAHKRLEDAKKLQGDLKKQIDSTTSASDALKSAWNKLPGAQFFNQIGESFNMAKQGVGGLTTGMGVLRTAIVATGIGALVIAIMALFSWFTKTEAGADLLAKAMNVLQAVFRQYTESIGRLMSGDVIGFFKGMTTEMVQQVKAASDLADAIDALEEKESAFQVVQKAGMRDKAELLKMSKDETLSIEQRIDAVDTAMKISKELNEKELENQREHLRIISGGTDKIGDELIKKLEQSGLTMNNAKELFKKGNITQEDLDEANKGLASFLEIQQKGFDDYRELLVVRNKLTSKERAADNSDAKTAQEVELKTIQEGIDVKDNLRRLENARRLASIEDARLKEREKVEQDTQEKIMNLKGDWQQITEQTKLLREIQGQELAAIDEKYRQKKLADDKAAQEVAYQDKLTANEAELIDEINFLNRKYLEKQITEEQLILQYQAVALENAKKKLEIIKVTYGEESIEYKKQLGVVLELQKNASDASVKISEELAKNGAEMLMGSLNVFGNMFSQLAQMYAQGTEEWKAFATAQAIISTIQGAINAYTSASAVPIIGAILAPIAAGVALAAGYAQVRKIQSTPIPKPTARNKGRKGGVFNGPSHEQGGIPIEVEGDEIILTRGVYRNPGLRSLASAINVAGGGRQFAAGGPTNPFDASRGPAPRSSTPSVDPIQGLREAILSQTEAINARIDRIQVVNNLQDTERGLRTLNTLREEADL